MLKNNTSILILFFCFSFILTLIFFWGIDKRHFIYMGDQFFRFNYHEAFINSFFIRKPENLGVLNGWQFMTQFWDTLYYLFVYSFNISFITAEKILFFLVLFFSFIGSYFGFKKLNELFSLDLEDWRLFIITMWYCINPYTVILWHGGVYNLGSAMTYAIAPLILYFIHQTCFTQTNIRNVFICAILLYFGSFTFWLFAPLLFFLISYVLLYLILHRKLFLLFLKNILLLIPFYVLLASPIIFSILYEYFNNQGNNNATFTPTFTNQMGGIRFQLYMWFSWGIYNVWNPRSLFSYGEYYFSPWYVIPTKLLYLLILLGGLQISIRQWQIALKSKQKKLVFFLTPEIQLGIIFITIFFLSAFLAKGAQPPLGNIFLYLYNHIPLFSIFRTPDIRFGFPMVLSLAILLLFISRQYRTYIFFIGLGIIIFFQSLPFFTGIAIRGESIKNKYYNRILYIPNDYVQVAKFLNSDPGSGYILPIPSMSYGHYLLDGKKNHVGQDMLSKLIKRPFIYLSLSDGTYQKTYKTLYDALEKKDSNRLGQFPIKYIIFRNDVVCESCKPLSESDLGSSYKEVMLNKTFRVYKNEKYTPLINGNNVTFTQINPLEYRLSIRNLKKSEDINLLLSFSKDWKVFLNTNQDVMRCVQRKILTSDIQECNNQMRYFSDNELQYLWQKPILGKNQREVFGYANSWNIDAVMIKKNFNSRYYTMNKDGSVNISLTLYYYPQVWYLLIWFVSITSFILITIIVLRRALTNSRL